MILSKKGSEAGIYKRVLLMSSCHELARHVLSRRSTHGARRRVSSISTSSAMPSSGAAQGIERCFYEYAIEIW